MSEFLMKLIVASANRNKASEIVEILGEVEGLQLISRPEGIPEPAEDGATLLDNARIKAHALLEATGISAVADDTGLEVESLGGAPGVHTARYAGKSATAEANISKLLGAMSNWEDPDQRVALWRTVVVVAMPDGTEFISEGVCEGRIALEPWGTNGFGYDPVFIPDEGDGRTFAEMSSGEKHQISHRGRALQLLSEQLYEVWPG